MFGSAKAPRDPYPYARSADSRQVFPGLTAGQYVFVVDVNDAIHVAPDGPHMHPKVLGNAASALYAGEISVTGPGAVDEVTNLSGTFRFKSKRSLCCVAAGLRQLGFTVGDVVWYPPGRQQRPRHSHVCVRRRAVAKCILVLETDGDRRAAMHEWLNDRFGVYEAVLTADPAEFLETAGKCSRNILAASVNLDAPGAAAAFTARLIKLGGPFPALLYSSRWEDGEQPRSLLTANGWTVTWVTPGDGTDWIATDWYPALKRAIRAAAPREKAPVNDAD